MEVFVLLRRSRKNHSFGGEEVKPGGLRRRMHAFLFGKKLFWVLMWPEYPFSCEFCGPLSDE